MFIMASEFDLYQNSRCPIHTTRPCDHRPSSHPVFETQDVSHSHNNHELGAKHQLLEVSVNYSKSFVT
jgi:hypothetical protein